MNDRLHVPQRLPVWTLWEPWASAVLFLGKDVENRPRCWGSYIGRDVVVHAAKRKPTQEDLQAFSSIVRSARLAGHDVPDLRVEDLMARLGHAIGIVRCTGAEHIDSPVGQRLLQASPWAVGPWLHRLDRPRPAARPVPVCGVQGPWFLEGVALQQLLESIAPAR